MSKTRREATEAELEAFSARLKAENKTPKEKIGELTEHLVKLARKHVERRPDAPEVQPLKPLLASLDSVIEEKRRLEKEIVNKMEEMLDVMG